MPANLGNIQPMGMKHFVPLPHGEDPWLGVQAIPVAPPMQAVNPFDINRAVDGAIDWAKIHAAMPKPPKYVMKDWVWEDMDIKIPDWTKYLVQTPNGIVWACEQEPIPKVNAQGEVYHIMPGRKRIVVESPKYQSFFTPVDFEEDFDEDRDF